MVEYSNISVTAGAESDWAVLGVDSFDAQGETPWYVKMTVTVKGGSGFEYSDPSIWVSPYTERDDWLFSSFVNYDNSICPASYFEEEPKIGEAKEFCTVYSVATGLTIDRLEYEGRWDDQDRNEYYEKPVVWKAG